MSEPLLPVIRVSLDLPEFIVKSIDASGKKLGMTRAEFIREALRDFAELSDELLRGMK